MKIRARNAKAAVGLILCVLLLLAVSGETATYFQPVFVPEYNESFTDIRVIVYNETGDEIHNEVFLSATTRTSAVVYLNNVDSYGNVRYNYTLELNVSGTWINARNNTQGYLSRGQTWLGNYTFTENVSCNYLFCTVPWAQLADVPAGLDDGDDDTTYACSDWAACTDDSLWDADKLDGEHGAYYLDDTDTSATTECNGDTTYLDGDGGCDDLSGVYLSTTALENVTVGTIVGFTASSYDGDISSGPDIGYVAANKICDAEYGGSYFCTVHEILYTLRINWSFSDTYWIANGPPGYTANADDCQGWTSNDNTFLGPFWNFDGNAQGGYGRLTNCAQLKKLACCKQ